MQIIEEKTNNYNNFNVFVVLEHMPRGSCDVDEAYANDRTSKDDSY